MIKPWAKQPSIRWSCSFELFNSCGSFIWGQATVDDQIKEVNGTEVDGSVTTNGEKREEEGTSVELESSINENE